jgi:hypothetical protein
LILWPFGPVALVYDVMDTEGQNPPSDVFKLIAIGTMGETEIAAFRERARRKNIVWADLDAGDAKPGSIRCTGRAANEKDGNQNWMLVNKNHSPAVRFATVAHELAHLFLGHLGGDRALHVKDRFVLGHHQVELEAESVAFMVCKRNSITSKSETYLANYVRENTTIRDLDIYQVVRAAGQVETLLGLGTKPKF